MRITLVCLFAFAAACTKPNPATCCVTEEQCAALGADELRPCEIGQACGPNFSCVAAECETSADCTDPSAPVCSLGLCVDSCRIDDDCADVAGRPFCATDGVCVGCESNGQCPAEAAFCDDDTRACRGCVADDECTGGVCLELDATCELDANVIFVDGNSGQDTGPCSRVAPCATVPFAIAQAAGREVVHIGSSSVSLGPNSIVLPGRMYIDGVDSTLIGDSTPLFNPPPSGVLTLGRVRLAPSSGGSAFVAANAETVRIFASTVERQIEAGEGLLTIERSTLARVVICNSGTLSIHASTFAAGAVDAQICQVDISRTRFDGLASIQVIGGSLTYENNLAVIGNLPIDFMTVASLAPTSVIRFSTFVSVGSAPHAAVDCDSTPDVASNIFNYETAQPFASGCSATFSLFDSLAMSSQTTGQGNVVVDAATIFADRGGLDFHLATDSAAKEGADPSQPITEDLEGSPRPQPLGTVADMGAFEAP